MTNIYKNWLKTQALASVMQPLSVPIDSNAEDYLADQGYGKLGWRHLRRRVQFALSGQKKYLKNHLQTSWKRGLWIYKGIPQIGDALMDLAPRSLLQQQGFKIDLYTDPHLASMFNDDPWFEQVYDNTQTISSEIYDFVIVPSYKGRSLRHKSSLTPKLSWVSMHDFYTGPEFNRGQFATQRIIDLLGCKATQLEFVQHQQQKLLLLATAPTEKRNFKKIAFALGGVDELRTYKHWLSLATALTDSGINIEFTLLGSANALEAAQEITSRSSNALRINNHVNKTSITECRNLIHQQDLLITADGGLMHLGSTTGTKLVSLFHSTVKPHWRLSGKHLNAALQSTTSSVSDIPLSLITQKAIDALQ